MRAAGSRPVVWCSQGAQAHDVNETEAAAITASTRGHEQRELVVGAVGKPIMDKEMSGWKVVTSCSESRLGTAAAVVHTLLSAVRQVIGVSRVGNVKTVLQVGGRTSMNIVESKR
jgi:hypothetical protein